MSHSYKWWLQTIKVNMQTWSLNLLELLDGVHAKQNSRHIKEQMDHKCTVDRSSYDLGSLRTAESWVWSFPYRPAVGWMVDVRVRRSFDLWVAKELIRLGSWPIRQEVDPEVTIAAVVLNSRKCSANL